MSNRTLVPTQLYLANSTDELLQLLQTGSGDIFSSPDSIAHAHQRVKILHRQLPAELLSKKRSETEQVLNMLTDHAIAHAKELKPHHLVMILTSYAAMLTYKIPKNLFAALEQRCLEVADDFDERGIASCLWSFAKIDERPRQELFDALCLRGCKVVDSCNEQVRVCFLRVYMRVCVFIYVGF